MTVRVVLAVAKTCISFISIFIFIIRVLDSFETLVITYQTAVTRRRRPESSVIKFIHSFILQPFLQQIHNLFQRVRSSASSFNLQYPLFSLRSSSSCLRLLPRHLVTSILPSIFPSITCFRRQFLREM
jgi:hypothetical protein